jgi:hypothetical protein
MTHPLHEIALTLAKDYLRLESELISLLQRIEGEKVHLQLGYRSLFQYCVEGLGLGENQAYTFIGVSRKCLEVPTLQTAIDSGQINTSAAKRILPVIDKTNSKDWIAKAIVLRQKELEREVAKENPEKVIKEHLKQVTVTQSEFRAVVSPELEKKLSRCREVVSQKNKNMASWAEVLGVMTDEFLRKHDPVEKAKRNLQVARQVRSHAPTIPSQAKPQVMRRDGGSRRFTVSPKLIELFLVSCP